MTFVALVEPNMVRELYGAAYYDSYGGVDAGYDADPVGRSYESRRRVAFLKRFVARGRLLEIGCASGFFLEAADSAGFRVTGVEPSAEQAAIARARAGDVRAGFLEDLAFEPGAFDVACAWHVLEHIPDPVDGLRRLHCALRPGGILALEVPNAGSRQAIRLGAAWPHWDPAHHLNHFTRDALVAAVRRAGFTVTYVDTLPGTAYYPLRQVVRVRTLGGYAIEAIGSRTVPRRAHPTRHELLRLVAAATPQRAGL
jgi:SAM-dependent methyltransferase